MSIVFSYNLIFIIQLLVYSKNKYLQTINIIICIY